MEEFNTKLDFELHVNYTATKEISKDKLLKNIVFDIDIDNQCDEVFVNGVSLVQKEETEKRIYAIRVSDIPDGRTFYELSNYEIMDICKYTGMVWSSFDSFINLFNNDATFRLNSENYYIRIIECKKHL